MQNLFIAKFIKTAITPKGKRRRTAGGNSVQPKTKAPNEPPPAAPAPTPPHAERNSFAGFYCVLAGLLALLLLLLLLMRRRK